MRDTRAKMPFSCVAVGSTTLLIQCVRLLQAAGHAVCGLFSNDSAVELWGTENNVSVHLPDRLAEFVSNSHVDYIFSIVNHQILDSGLLNLHSSLVINYHDGPLPGYAGIHATSWAILNNETTHGVTWHVVSEQIDAGDILKQRLVPIDQDEIAFTLNAKCYEAAIQSFVELVDDLGAGNLKRIPQDLRRRTFFSRHKKLPNAGLLLWDSSANELSALVRATSFGPYPNALGSAKIVIDGTYYVVHELSVLGSRSSLPPGTLVSHSNGIPVIATKTHDVALSRLTNLAGDAVSMDGLLRDTRLPIPTSDDIKALEELDKKCSPQESFWVKRLSQLQPLKLSRSGDIGTGHSIGSLSKRTPAEPSFLLTALLAYLTRLTNLDYFDIGLIEDTGHGLFATQIPVRIFKHPGVTAKEFSLGVESELVLIKSQGTYMLDVPARYPALARRDDSCLTINIHLTDQLESELKLRGELTLQISGDGQYRWIYDSATTSPLEIERLSTQFETFLQDYASKPDSLISKLNLMSPHELNRVLVEWNATSAPADLKCIHEYFEEQVQRTPDATAVICNEQRLSYKEFNDHANTLACALRQSGVKPESLIGICLHRSIDLIVGLLGILKSGAAYVPLDPTYPKERLSFIIEDTSLAVIITQSDLVEKLPPHHAQLLLMHTCRSTPVAETDVRSGVATNNLAYVIYTSGSTGKPKGVAIEHRSTATLIEWTRGIFSAAELAGVLASTSICFDLSVFEIFVPLSCGGSVILVENALHLKETPAANRVTLINTVPSAMSELLRMGAVPRSVLTVNLAGEPLPTSLVKKIYENTSARKVFDLYGPSEDTTYSTFALRSADEPPTIGRPISNTQVYLLDENLEPVPIGTRGELYLGGGGLARGYLNRPELTKERFIPNPFSNEPESRLYRTGDLAEHRNDGSLKFLGRLDHQVKIRGFRIELDEIQSVLNRHPAVQESVVVAHEDQAGMKSLAAYVVPLKNQLPTLLELREFLQQKLPPFMVPGYFSVLKALPQTANGKLDRKALPKPEAIGIGRTGTFVAARTEVERDLVKLWEEILKTQPVGATQDFFELGGHSLLAIEMLVEVERKYGKQLPLATLLRAPTIEKLAALLAVDEEGTSLSSLVPIQTSGSKTPFFCIHARGGNVLFYRDLAKRLGPNQPVYGLQMRGLDGKHPHHTCVEDMAAHYLAEIRTVQPHGPYYLGGASFGGTVAFEMSHQLLAQGEDVGLLALFDTTAPGYPKMPPKTKKWRSKFYELERRLEYQLDSFKLLSGKERYDYLQLRLRKARVKLIRTLKLRGRSLAVKFSPRFRRLLFSQATLSPWALMETERIVTQALSSYKHVPYPGRLTLFRASKQPLGIVPDPTLGWKKLVTGALEIREVPGYHGAIVAEPHVQFLATELQECLSVVNDASRRQVAQLDVMHKLLPPSSLAQSSAGLQI